MKPAAILLPMLIAACSVEPAKDQRGSVEISNQVLEDIALSGRITALERRLDAVEKRKAVTIVAPAVGYAEGRDAAPTDLVERLKRRELETRVNDLETQRRLDSYRR